MSGMMKCLTLGGAILCVCALVGWGREPIRAFGSRWDLDGDGCVSFPDYAVLVRGSGRAPGIGSRRQPIRYPILADFCSQWLAGDWDVTDPNVTVPNVADPNGDIPPLYFFYAIHTHGTSDYLPYADKLQKRLDSQTAENMIAAIEGISSVLDRYGVVGTWELVEGTAQGIPEYQGENHIFKQLLSRGHEIAAHAHKVEDTAAVVGALRDSCGVVPVTTSGFITQVSRADAGSVQSAMAEAIQTAVDLGLTVGTDNLSPGGKDLVSQSCPNGSGVGNDMWAETGNLMFPWRPDYLNSNTCADNPAGRMVFVNHVSIEWLILPDSPGPPDVLDGRHFEQLKGYFDAALRYMEENRPERVACWGFVTHIIEYAVGGAAENPPESSALEALDGFLSYADSKRAEGRVVYATSNEIADLAYPQVEKPGNATLKSEPK